MLPHTMISPCTCGMEQENIFLGDFTRGTDLVSLEESAAENKLPNSLSSLSATQEGCLQTYGRSTSL